MQIRAFHDASHGAANEGIVWPPDRSGIIEKNWSLAFVAMLLRRPAQPEIVQMASRTTDTPLSLRERAMLAHNFNAHIAFSHHVNGLFHTRKIIGHEHNPGDDEPVEILGEIRPNLAGSGLICFARADDEIGIEVGNAMMRASPMALVRAEPETFPAVPTNWTKNAYNVLKPYGDTPAVLVEWGYATHPEDRVALLDPATELSRYATLLAGIGRLYELLDGRG